MTDAPLTVIGKSLPDAFYFHISLRNQVGEKLSQLLEAAEQAANLKPDADYNVIKVMKNAENISFLLYEQFFEDPFPKLAQSIIVKFPEKRIARRVYSADGNRPILHRKELLIPDEDPNRGRYVALTKQLELLGLFINTNAIGYDRQWQEKLSGAGIEICDHQIVVASDREELLSDGSLTKSDVSSIHRHKTAIRRYSFSSPMQSINRYGYLSGEYSLFDYGCGQGDDLKILNNLSLDASGWDPFFFPDNTRNRADIVNLGFVLNVIDDQEERSKTLQTAFSLADIFLVVSVMLNGQSSGGTNFADGVVTSRNTFQKYYSQAELRDYIFTVLGVEPVAVASGIFYVFKDRVEEQKFLEKRYRSDRIYLRSGAYLEREARLPRLTRDEKEKQFLDKHHDILRSLEDLWYDLGRKPIQSEHRNSDALIELFGNWNRAVNFVERLVDPNLLSAAQQNRTNELLAYFAMVVFEGRKPYSQLPEGLQQDVKVFFNNYQNAKDEGQKLLFSAGNQNLLFQAISTAVKNNIGTLIGQSQLQVHKSMIPRLDPILKVYISCGAVLYGDFELADLIKIHGDSGKVTFMKFDDFEESPLPLMRERVKVNLRTQDTDIFSYGDEFKQPYLYWKSKLLPNDHPDQDRQRKFDADLEGLGIFSNSPYGPHPDVLQAKLQAFGLKIDGFELVESGGIPESDAPCGKNFRFQDFIACGQTWQKTNIANVPQQSETYQALRELCGKVLDPVIDYFGDIELTYGFCSRLLAKEIPSGIDSSRDQHASCELNTKSKLICPRKGAAADFLVRDECMLEVAQWIAANTEFDRIYYYGTDRPLHVSVGPEKSRQVVLIKENEKGHRIPRVIDTARFLAMIAED